jgi:membrane-bound inhibitor of C-type lysozyme
MTAIVSPMRDWSILVVPRGKNMNCNAIANFAAALLMTAFAGASMAQAQTTFKTYRCADGTEFIVGFFQYDKRAHMQVDGKAVTLLKRLALTGARYSGGGVTLRTTKSGTTLKVGKRKVTACEVA